MATIDTLREVVRDLLPSGPFWLSDAVASYVEALAGAFVELVDFIESLPATLSPLTAARAVLVDWWEYMRSECSATPTDTEELRAKVLEALAAPPSYTFAGLQGVVSANVQGIVELRELPAVSDIPSDVPFDVNPHARILEAWYSSFLTSEAQLRCVLGVFAQAADTIRLVSPDTELRIHGGNLADERAMAWEHVILPMDLAIDRVSGATGVASGALYSLADEPHGVDTLDNVLTVASATDLQEDWFSWHLERDADQISPTRTSADDVLDGLETITGLTFDEVFFGRRTGARGEWLDVDGAPTVGASTGLVGLLGDRAYKFTAVDDISFKADDQTIGEISDTESWLCVVVIKPTATVSTDVPACGKQDLFQVIPTPRNGWQVWLRNSGNVLLDLSDTAGGTALSSVARTYTTNQWLTIVARINRTTQLAQVAHDAGAGAEASVAGMSYLCPAMPLRIGDSRVNRTQTAPPADVHLVAFAHGAQVEAVSLQTLAAAITAALT
jgi:hypothetical protein